MERSSTAGLTPVGYRYVGIITLLSVAHHIDHVIRDVTGWPFGGGFNAFSASLFVYPVIAAGVVLSRRGGAGPGFWTVLAGGAAVFLLVIHLGPAAGDDAVDIPSQYGSPIAAVVALVVLAALIVGLSAHAVYEFRRAAAARNG